MELIVFFLACPKHEVSHICVSHAVKKIAVYSSPKLYSQRISRVNVRVQKNKD